MDFWNAIRNSSPGDPKPRGARRRAIGSRDDAEELIASNFELLNAELARDIVGRVHSFSPAFFERLIIDLLVRMGYGGGRVEMGQALGRVGDGGVDGVIKEDELGLDVVYVQAKRLDPNKAVPLSEVRDFVGGLEGHRASKGVLVTTSYFPSTAYDFITRVSKRVVLIDGQALANLMIFPPLSSQFSPVRPSDTSPPRTARKPLTTSHFTSAPTSSSGESSSGSFSSTHRRLPI